VIVEQQGLLAGLTLAVRATALGGAELPHGRLPQLLPRRRGWSPAIPVRRDAIRPGPLWCMSHSLAGV